MNAQLPSKPLDVAKQIASLKHENAKLKIELENYKCAIDAANEGVWSRDLKSGRIWSSPKWKQLLYQGVHNCPNNFEELLKIIHPEDRAAFLRSIEHHLSEPSTMYKCIFRLQDLKHGGYRTILSRGRVSLDESGEPIRLSGTHTDITAFKNNELFSINDNFVEAIIDAIPSLVFIKKLQEFPDGFSAEKKKRIEFYLVNDALARFYGRSKAKIIGKTDADFSKKPDELSAFFRADLDVIEKGEAICIEQEYATDASGVTHCFTTHKIPITLPDGQPGVLGIATYIDDLIENTRISQSNAIWEKISYQIAHQVGNSVYEVEGALCVLKTLLSGPKRPSSQRCKKTLQRIAESLTKSKGFINHFKELALSKQIHPTTFDVVSTINRLREPAKNDNVKIHIQTPQKFLLFADEDKLYDCLLELYINSTKWLTKKKEKKIRVTGRKTTGSDIRAQLAKLRNKDSFTPSAEYFEISVSDNGPGIAKAKKEKIFNLFFSDHPTNGTGIGLTSVRETVHEHGGAVYEMGKWGSGADFRIWLPVIGNGHFG